MSLERSKFEKQILHWKDNLLFFLYDLNDNEAGKFFIFSSVMNFKENKTIKSVRKDFNN